VHCGRSKSLKVNRMPICDFLLVFHCNYTRCPGKKGTDGTLDITLTSSSHRPSCIFCKEYYECTMRKY